VLRQAERADDLAGPLDRALFDRLLPDLGGRTIFCCGPQGYMDAARSFAQARGFDMDYFHCETFSAEATRRVGTPAANDGAATGTAYALEVPDFGRSTGIAPGQTLLEALEGAGVPIVGACRSGVCGSCKCRVVAGEVDSTSTATLHADEIAAGYVLACSSTARSNLTVAL
jgi:NADH oxidoreductase Hcr